MLNVKMNITEVNNSATYRKLFFANSDENAPNKENNIKTLTIATINPDRYRPLYHLKQLKTTVTPIVALNFCDS